MSSATLRNGIDSWVGSNEPGTNRGGDKRLIVRSDGTITNYSYIYFKNPAPRGATVTSATLRLFSLGTFASKAVRARLIIRSWRESFITWNNAPDVSGVGPTVTQASTADGQEWAFDVTALLQALSDGQANYGFRLAATVVDATIARFYSLDSAVNQPVLDVEWSDAPVAPHTLSPSGGRATSLAAPVLRFDYADPAGQSPLTAVQVQVNNNADQFTTPTFDSGTVATTLPELDLSTTTYVGLTAGDTAWWQVRVQDAAGLWSDWSDAAKFTRTAKGTLAINSPAAGGTVTDVTPPILWTFSGGTQSQWRVTVALADDPTDLLHDTGWRSGADASYTLPKRVLVDQGATYRLTVYSVDSVDRESTPGDPKNVNVTHDFNFAESATVPPVVGLTAQQVQNGRPWVQLDWTRSVAPDSYTVTRDGRTVDSGLDPADLIVSGTSYRYVDRQAAPYVPHTWKVQAVVGGKASASNPTATLTYKVGAVWLVDPDTDRTCPIITGSNGNVEATMPEVSATYGPIGSKRSVRIIQTQRGLEGTITGFITEYGGSKASLWESNLLIFKRQPTNVLRMTLGSKNLRVKIGQVSIVPREGADPDDRDVSFAFWSQDGPE